VKRIAKPFLGLLSSRSKQKIDPTAEGAKVQVVKTQARKKEQEVKRNSYRATSIDFDESCCDAIKAIGQKRFLLAQGKIPLLPLTDCDAAECSCTYVHHDDRRDYDGERRHVGSLKTDLYGETGEENRATKTRGRRRSDS